jgi:hypothetical protein
LATPEEEAAFAAFVADEEARKAGGGGAPPVSPVTAGTVGFGQGVSLGFSDELGAAIDTGISKIPGLRHVAEGINALGGHPGLSPLTADLSYEQRRDEYRQRNADMRSQRPIATAAGQVAGGIAVSPVLGPGSAASTPVRLGALAAEGAATGVGVNERPEEMLSDIGKGAAINTAFGIPGIAAQKYIAGAPARNEARQLKQLGVSSTTAGRAKVKDGELASHTDDVVELLKRSRPLRQAAGDPRRVVEATQANIAPLAKRTGEIYAAADAATSFGGMDPVAARKVLNTAIDKAVSSGAPKATISRLKAIVDQVEALEEARPWQTAAGSGTARVIPSEKLRTFVTDRLKPTQAETQSGAAEAVTDAAVALKGLIAKHVGKAAGELDQLNKEISTNLIVQQAALKKFDATRNAVPQPRATIKQSVQAAGGKALDKLAARPGAAAVESGARRAVTQQVIDYAAADDRERATKMLEQEIFGP